MKKILIINFLLISFFMLTITSVVQAQTGDCAFTGMGGTDCLPSGANCDPEDVLRNNCRRENGNCVGIWWCEPANNSCQWLNNTCTPRGCADGYVNPYNCSQHLNLTDCLNTPELNCVLSSNDCSISGATDCEPNWDCPDGEILNPDYLDTCHEGGVTGCLTKTFSGDKCIEPQGYDCIHPITGYQCVPCATGPCDFTDEAVCTANCDADFEPPDFGDAPSPLDAGSCTGQDAIYTAIGCIPIGGEVEFVSFFLRWAIGIAGGIALLLVVYAGVQIITAGGDPKKVAAGKELLTAAIGGFVFLLLSVYLLQFIGVRILEIPGF